MTDESSTGVTSSSHVTAYDSSPLFTHAGATLFQFSKLISVLVLVIANNTVTHTRNVYPSHKINVDKVWNTNKKWGNV